MNKMNTQKATLFLCWMLLCMDSCLSQKDCTGVECPPLLNCIETSFEKGTCCPTCAQKGCTCEGYQYYDCIQAGFQKGKVPEGESYFVDFGSTECSCPKGGGNIICQFIPCPELPPNCIDISQPADGCLQCRKVGCTHGNKKYDAGHSFQMDHCRVCHCPNEGGKLMCSPIPGCDPRSSNKPTWVTTTENNNPLRDVNSRQMTPMEPFSKLAPGNTLPLYKQDPPKFGTEDYDYTLAGPTSSPIQDLAKPLESTTVPPAYPESNSTSFSSHNERRHEQRETEIHADPEPSRKAAVAHNVSPTTAEAQSETSTLRATTQTVTTENLRPHQEPAERPIGPNSGSKIVSQDASTDAAHESRQKPSQGSRTSSQGHSVGHKQQKKVSVERRQPAGREEQESHPRIHFGPTSRVPVRMKEVGEQPQRQPQTLHNYQSQDEEADTEGTLTYPRERIWPFMFHTLFLFHKITSRDCKDINSLLINRITMRPTVVIYSRVMTMWGCYIF